MSNVGSVIVPIASAAILAAGASVFTRRRYSAEIRGLDAATNRVAVDTIAETLRHQGEYIKTLEERLTRAEVAATRALQAETTCRAQLAELSAQFSVLAAQLADLQKGK